MLRKKKFYAMKEYLKLQLRFGQVAQWVRCLCPQIPFSARAANSTFLPVEWGRPK